MTCKGGEICSPKENFDTLGHLQLILDSILVYKYIHVKSSNKAK